MPRTLPDSEHREHSGAHRPRPHAAARASSADSAGSAKTAVIFVLCAVVFIASTVLAIRGFTSRADEEQLRLDCRARMVRLGRGVAAEIAADPGRAFRPGPAFLLELRKTRRRLAPGDESAFLCPADPAAPELSGDGASRPWDEVDLDAPAPGLCSFAVRDFAAFPLDPESLRRQPVAVCLHHPETLTLRGGANVLFSDGTASWLGFEELGISEGRELVAGPASLSPLLRQMLPPAQGAARSGRDGR